MAACSTCRHYLPDRQECRRLPPQIVHTHLIPDQFGGEARTIQLQAFWPCVEKEDWCGEHAPRGEPDHGW
jgi:hypothetical protein